MRFSSTICICLLLITILNGCVPDNTQLPTQVKKTSEIEISVGTTKPEEPEQESATPAESTAPAAETTVAASPAKAMDKPVAATEPEETATPAAASAGPAHTGPAKFTGRVVVKGNAPELSPLVPAGKEMKDAICSEVAVEDESVLVSADGGLANCFVYMKRGPKSGVPEPAGETPVLDQKGCVFLPHAQVVRTNVTMQLKNSDPVAHNVHSLPFKNKGVNSLIPGNDETGIETTFEYAEGLPVRVVCDIHAWMIAYVLPVDHPWATVTDENGNFEITDLPDGEWTFVVWHEKIGNINNKFEVEAAQGKVITETFEVDASKLSQ